jgi:uncharacterized membrane protein
LADDLHRNDDIDFKELLRTVHDLSLRVQQLERRLIDELPDGYSPSAARQNVVSRGRKHSSLESRIGSHWLNRIGVIALLFGVAYLLRYAFVSKWVSAAVWIWLGVSTGIAIILSSEWFRRRGYRLLSLSLKATGIGVSYLCLWAGLELYQLLSGSQTFSGLVVLTILAAVLALRESAEALAALAMIGGFLTPLLISIPAREVPLFSYIAILDCAAAASALKQTWWKLLPLNFLATSALCMTWYFKDYSRTELLTAVLAATFFFAIFCLSAYWVRGPFSTGATRYLLVSMEVANPLLYFAGLYLLIDPVLHNAIAIPTLGLSALYFAFATNRDRQQKLGVDIRVAVYGALGVAFFAITLAVLLRAEWLSLAWFAEGAVVMTIGFWRHLSWLRWGALLLLCGAVVKAFAWDVWQLGLAYRTLSFTGLGVLLLVISFAYQRYRLSIVAKTGKSSANRLH